MKYFIPIIGNKTEAEMYETIQTFIEKEMGSKVTDRKIYFLENHHGGKTWQYKVGDVAVINGELIYAILEMQRGNLFCVCTENRGIRRGIPLLVGANEVREIVDFED